jgi:hypothetical protein
VRACWSDTFHPRRLHRCSAWRVDDWLSTGTRSRYYARTFLLWSAQHGHAPRGLEISILPNDSAPGQITDDERWATVQRLLHDNSINTVDRVAGLLVLLFGQPQSRIVQITVDQVSALGDSITLGDTPLLMPAPIDALVEELREHRQGRALIARHIDALALSRLAHGKATRDRTAHDTVEAVRNPGQDPHATLPTSIWPINCPPTTSAVH